MLNITIDGNFINNINDLHNELKNKLHLPIYYGNNLDSLDECLYDYKDLIINFINTSKLVYNLENKFFILLDILKDHKVIVKMKVNY